MDRSWYKSFFSGPFVDMWRDAVTPELTRLEADFLERVLRLEPGQKVLDIPCGFGRHCLELSKRGYQMTGVDGSAEMIDLAKKFDQEGRIEWQLEIGRAHV